MLRKLLIAGIFLLFAGCSCKTTNFLAPDRTYSEALRYTQQGDIAISLENKALIIATYLNPIKKSTKGDEEFFVRVYIDNDIDDPKRSGLFHPGYTLTLNGKKPLAIKAVDKNSELAKSMPAVLPWYKLYVVRFAHTEATTLRLEFANAKYGKVVLTYPNFLLD